jgi:hypothetical protein
MSGIQHAQNVVVLAVPVASWWTHAPEICTTAAAFMAFLYYLLYFAKEIAIWRKGWHTVHTTTVSETVTEDHKVVAGKSPDVSQP